METVVEIQTNLEKDANGKWQTIKHRVTEYLYVEVKIDNEEVEILRVYLDRIYDAAADYEFKELDLSRLTEAEIEQIKDEALEYYHEHKDDKEDDEPCHINDGGDGCASEEAVFENAP